MDHKSVLLKDILEVFDYIAQDGGVFVDGTLGAGGHSIAIASQYKDLKFQIVGFDKDTNALELAKRNVSKAKLQDHFIFVHSDFKYAKSELNKLGINRINGALLDLGVSSMQLDDKGRGFSFSDPSVELDMRMDQEQKLTAREAVNNYSTERLEWILSEYGEERYAKSIAKNISIYRGGKPINTVGDLLEIIEVSIPVKAKHQKIHFATRTFQALRIEVNKELEGLDKAISDLVEMLEPKAKLAVISFHSLEDRIVKNIFKQLASECSCPPDAPICTCDKTAKVKLLTKKPIIPSEDEIKSNPRSRSAKLRVVEKL